MQVFTQYICSLLVNTNNNKTQKLHIYIGPLYTFNYLILEHHAAHICILPMKKYSINSLIVKV